MTPFIRLSAIALPIAQANLDTDQIIPARYLQKPRSEDFGQYVFHNLRQDPKFLLNHPAYRDARIVVGGTNFGCGSSREHAVWALYDYGIRAVIAPSFGDIFYANALKNGLLPVVLSHDVVDDALDALLAMPCAIDVDLLAMTVTMPDGAIHEFAVDPFSRHCLLQGIDELDYTLSQLDRIADFERRYQETR